MNHAGAFCHSAQVTGFAVNFKFNRILFFYGICCHNGSGSLFVSVIIKLFCKNRNSIFYRLNRKYKPDNTRACNNNLFSRNIELVCNKLAHSFCLFYAVCIAGVGIFGVGNHCNCLVAAFFKVSFCNCNRRTLNFVLRINCRCCAYSITFNHTNIIFMWLSRILIVYTRHFYPTVNSAGFKALCSTYAAVNNFHIFILL